MKTYFAHYILYIKKLNYEEVVAVVVVGALRLARLALGLRAGGAGTATGAGAAAGASGAAAGVVATSFTNFEAAAFCCACAFLFSAIVFLMCAFFALNSAYSEAENNDCASANLE